MYLGTYQTIAVRWLSFRGVLTTKYLCSTMVWFIVLHKWISDRGPISPLLQSSLWNELPDEVNPNICSSPCLFRLRSSPIKFNILWNIFALTAFSLPNRRASVESWVAREPADNRHVKSLMWSQLPHTVGLERIRLTSECWGSWRSCARLKYLHSKSKGSHSSKSKK